MEIDGFIVFYRFIWAAAVIQPIFELINAPNLFHVLYTSLYSKSLKSEEKTILWMTAYFCRKFIFAFTFSLCLCEAHAKSVCVRVDLCMDVLIHIHVCNCMYKYSKSQLFGHTFSCIFFFKSFNNFLHCWQIHLYEQDICIYTAMKKKVK